MYKITGKINSDVVKLKDSFIEVACANHNTVLHKTKLWKKVTANQYQCNDCGCKMTMNSNSDYKEEKIDG